MSRPERWIVENFCFWLVGGAAVVMVLFCVEGDWKGYWGEGFVVLEVEGEEGV